METWQLIRELGYADSPHFLTPSRFDDVPAHAHVFRRAARHCSLQGVYLLRDQESASTTPVVYVAEAADTAEADSIHRQVWNQSSVPFLLVRTPRGIRLYSGFTYQRNLDPEQPPKGLLQSLAGFHEVSLRLAAFHADRIDDGGLWKVWRHKVRPEERVDHRLLSNLETVGRHLHAEGVPRESAHALIGKLVYLRYLRDRNILSDRRLGDWDLRPEQVFGRKVEPSALEHLVHRLDDWLNGEIFPLSFRQGSKLSSQQIERTAAVFLGDDPRSGQLHLDFQAYDFSHIPIETLSTIYEQFLAVEGSRRQSGAFYTPIPLVHFMIAEMEDHKPLERGTRVLDPACGSGAFLVQCYRRLIEKRMAEEKRSLRPAELRDVLVRQIFGVDRDGDACRVAQMSLILTMLDYIDPPDLQSTPQFKLPKLHNRNIHQSDFFDESSSWSADSERKRYDWVIGNPPWIELAPDSRKADVHAWRWLDENATRRPVTQKQTAEIFAWEASRYLKKGGVAGLLLPGMTLFKQNRAFRRRFFAETDVLGIANFTNLRRDLFVRYIDGKRTKMEIPAATFFFQPKASSDPALQGSGGTIPIYSPLLANQEAVRPQSTRRRAKVWDLAVNASEIRFVAASEAATGRMLPWKLAMWGTERDRRLLGSIDNRFVTLGEWSEQFGLSLCEGPQLRKKGSSERIEPAHEIIGKKRLTRKHLRNTKGIHGLVSRFAETISPEYGFVREGRRERPLSVCRPPHVIVSAARNYAFYTEEYLVVLPRQIGIAGPPEHSGRLKALALYLSSDFAKYVEFFQSPQWGIRDGRSTLATLKKLPVPLGDLTEPELSLWCELHGELAAASRRYLEAPSKKPGPLPKELRELEVELNRTVSHALGLSERERRLVHDLVHIRMHLTDGKLGEPAVRRPDSEDLSGYGERLRDELDSFVDPGDERAHKVTLLSGKNKGLVAVEMVARKKDSPVPVEIRDRGDALTKEMERLEREHQRIARQWIYFDRNLFVYDHRRTLILKPQQRFWWTESQAMSDADEIVSAALAPAEPAA